MKNVTSPLSQVGRGLLVTFVTRFSPVSFVAFISFSSYVASMKTFTFATSSDSIVDAEKALTALLPLARKRGRYVHLQLMGSEQMIALSRETLTIVIEVLRQMTQGGATALVPLEEELSSQQAADILNVSRPYLIRLLDKGIIPSRKVGKHRRVLMNDLLAYKKSEENAQRVRLDELTAEAQRLGLGY
jgi:excisionase family DNA binding protein